MIAHHRYHTPAPGITGLQGLQGLRGLRGLRGLADDPVVPSSKYRAVEPSLQEATKAMEAWSWAVGTPQGRQMFLGYLNGDANAQVISIDGKTYVFTVVPTNRNVTAPAGAAKVVAGENSYLVRRLEPLTTTSTETPASGPAGCPCRTETTVVQKTVVIPVRQTRVICDTPPPTSTVPPCDEVTAAVRSQLNAQGVQGLRGPQGLSSCGCQTPALSGTAVAPTTAIRPSRDAIATTTAPSGATITTEANDVANVTPWIAAGAAALLLFAIIK